jgi:hypothetical protein
MDKIRVYRRNPVENRMGLSVNRPWMVANVPEDYGRETCWPTLSDALDWATMDPKVRKAIIENDLKMEGGW